MNFQAEFELLLRSRYSIIYVQTREEERVEKTIAELAKKQGNRAVYIWDFVEGYENNPNDIGWGKRNPLQGLELVEKLPESAPAIFILRDFQRFLEDISISRKLRNLAKKLKSQPKNLVILAPKISIPEDLNEVITIIEFPLPNSQEISQEVERLLVAMGQYVEKRLLD
ncbi:MAG: AAA family ATPase, partial [Trichodesmium sp. St19_bin2]|nr:AAA family ATPase [Trichodesmium sp. St19_bin2]